MAALEPALVYGRFGPFANFYAGSRASSAWTEGAPYRKQRSGSPGAARTVRVKMMATFVEIASRRPHEAASKCVCGASRLRTTSPRSPVASAGDRGDVRGPGGQAEMMRKTEAILKTDTIVASNTSSLLHRRHCRRPYVATRAGGSAAEAFRGLRLGASLQNTDSHNLTLEARCDHARLSGKALHRSVQEAQSLVPFPS